MPADWMDDQCHPPGFEWADPSKIRIDEVYCLLAHWRVWKESGLAPIIWNQSCDILNEVEKPYKRLQNLDLGQSNVHSHTGSNEDFSKELEAICEHEEEFQHSTTPPPSPTPDRRASSGVEPSRYITPTIRTHITDHGRELAFLFIY
jgi:hypothetical protein